MSKVVAAEDEVTRFIRPKEKRYVNKSGNLKTQAYSISEDGGISVFITTGMTEQDIWTHGDEHYANDHNTIIGRGYLFADNVFSLNLQFDYNDSPPKHANIIGLLSDSDKNLSYRQSLAKQSKYQRRN